MPSAEIVRHLNRTETVRFLYIYGVRLNRALILLLHKFTRQQITDKLLIARAEKTETDG